LAQKLHNKRETDKRYSIGRNCLSTKKLILTNLVFKMRCKEIQASF
jgi:hypothetical protein